MSQKTVLITPYSILTLIVPPIALAYAEISNNFVFLDYVHVITGGTWTGIDLFMGLIMSRVLRSLEPNVRAEIIKRLVPMMLFFMPSLAAVATTAGIFIAMKFGIFTPSNLLIDIAGIIVIILIIQGFGIIMPNEVRIFLELRKDKPDTQKVIKLGMRNIYVSGSQSVFQIAIIFVMALLTI
ncbi:hypothetical protein [Acidianus manzaensis]|uniref:DUF2269 domain-containing protein n=1 Tax=Acidianus manzaensis TaxID=282676 RepID=A0A1W6JZ05_9CREN|nr:hypothetical protein [Acidianus manzaensis]ARM75506.1 hypothetical protein B6F84_05310 [Acidianus manzaensis]